MGRLIIDGTNVFEIDEECIKKGKAPKECDVEKYLKSAQEPPTQKPGVEKLSHQF